MPSGTPVQLSFSMMTSSAMSRGRRFLHPRCAAWTNYGSRQTDFRHSKRQSSRRGTTILHHLTPPKHGRAKAILLDHAAQVGAATALAGMWGLTPDDVTLVALPLGYLYGLSTAAAVGLQSGGSVAILRRFHPRDVLEGLVSHRATVYHGVPTMYSMMLEYCEQRDLTYDLSGIRALICAGAPLAEEMRERFAKRFGKAILDYYPPPRPLPSLAHSLTIRGRYRKARSVGRPPGFRSASCAPTGLTAATTRTVKSSCAPPRP